MRVRKKRAAPKWFPYPVERVGECNDIVALVFNYCRGEDLKEARPGLPSEAIGGQRWVFQRTFTRVIRAITSPQFRWRTRLGGKKKFTKLPTHTNFNPSVQPI